MLKKVRVLFLGLMVLAGSACVTPTRASSADGVIITYAQLAGGTGAKEEAIVIYNPTSLPISLANWYFKNNQGKEFARFLHDTTGEHAPEDEPLLPAYSYSAIVSEEYVSNHTAPRDFYGLIYTVTNQNSGSLATSGDTLQLLDANGVIINSVSWANNSSSYKTWGRELYSRDPDTYNNDQGKISDWLSLPAGSLPPRVLLFDDAQDAPPGDTGGQGDESDGDDGDENGDSEGDDSNEVGGGSGAQPDSPAIVPIVITEVLPNPAGLDAGNEFIELFNPNQQTAVSLETLQMRIGIDMPTWHSLAGLGAIEPQSYLVVYNHTIKFSLTNTRGAVQLFQGFTPAGDAVLYSNAKDNQSWALINEQWQYTIQPTPGLPNVPSPFVSVEVVRQPKQPKPCAANQFRNPETGRCKLLATAQKVPTPCKPGQYRSTETNRCRAIAQATVPAPCKPNQERNPETNRCKAIVKMTNADYKVQGVQTATANQPAWYYWGAIGGVISMVLAYALWEWRQEISTALNYLKRIVTHK